MDINIDIVPLLEWGIINKRPLIIAGPCSAESEVQLIKTAQELKKNDNINVFKAGIWKPIIRSKNFEGIDVQELTWLKQVKKETGLLIATEIANIKHLDATLKNNIDILWLGARTTANPFAVQEIAEALKGIDIIIFIKNPINPDIELWIDAIERINNAGIKKIGAIHGGFSSLEKTIYRNKPEWEILIKLKNIIPYLPIIVDPSHIGGKRNLIFDISQRALDLNFDGLMIESYYYPDNTLHDEEQQITPDMLMDMTQRLFYRHSNVDKTQLATLEELRIQIDTCDYEILNFLERRMKISDEIGKFKKNNNITILQIERWNNIINKYIEIGLLKGLSEECIKRIFTAIHQESIDHQTYIMNKI